MLAIKNNIMAATAARHLGTSYDALAKSVERLSSGLRINSAKDDAAGMAVRELIRADIAVLQQGTRNAQDGISMFQTMEAAMAVMDENLVRMKELAEQSANGTYSDAQRTIMDAEFAEMSNEIERAAQYTRFNNIAMLNEDAAADGSTDIKIHVGTTTTIDVQKVNMTKEGLGIETGDGGWTISTATATGTASTSDTTWLVLQDGSAGGTSGITMAITFMDSGTTTNNESAITVGFSTTTDATGFSLANVVNQINAASMNLGWDASGNDLRYSAAEAEYDSASSSYVLKLNSRGSNADLAQIAWSGIENTAAAQGTVSGAFTVSADATYSTSDLIITCMGLSSTGATQAGLNILTVDAAIAALSIIETAQNAKDAARATFGYKMNRLESTVSILEIASENLQAAESRISDVDVATEMAKMTNNQVLSQAGVAMLAQANSMPQMALTLLR
jgi:flagellin